MDFSFSKLKRMFRMFLNIFGYIPGNVLFWMLGFHETFTNRSFTVSLLVLSFSMRITAKSILTVCQEEFRFLTTVISIILFLINVTFFLSFLKDFWLACLQLRWLNTRWHSSHSYFLTFTLHLSHAKFKKFWHMVVLFLVLSCIRLTSPTDPWTYWEQELCSLFLLSIHTCICKCDTCFIHIHSRWHRAFFRRTERGGKFKRTGKDYFSKMHLLLSKMLIIFSGTRDH